jgi:hypothetical protein
MSGGVGGGSGDPTRLPDCRTRCSPLPAYGLEQAARLDEQHWTLHQRPISAESVRKELHIGAQRTRELVASVRAHGNGQPHHAG